LVPTRGQFKGGGGGKPAFSLRVWMKEDTSPPKKGSKRETGTKKRVHYDERERAWGGKMRHVVQKWGGPKINRSLAELSRAARKNVSTT